MELYRTVLRVYESFVGGRVFTAECWITMSVILNLTPSVQGATGLPRMCTLSVGDVRGPLPFSCTGPYSGCTKFRWPQSVHRPVVDYHEGHSELYT